MLRRVARVLRVCLLYLGLLLAVCIPVSRHFIGGVHASWPIDEWEVAVGGGLVQIRVFVRLGRGQIGAAPEAYVYRYTPRAVPLRWWGSLSHYRDSETFVISAAVPLWLLSAICLAWPVTSFIIARRRKARGFEVEPKKDNAVSTSDS